LFYVLNFYFKKEKVVIQYNKLHAEQKQGKTLDIVLKKIKHRIVDNMSSSTADALGLSRAILCNGKNLFFDFRGLNLKFLTSICNLRWTLEEARRVGANIRVLQRPHRSHKTPAQVDI
jgi:hypothetical protein